MQPQKPLNPSDQYYLDDLDRIRPVHEMGWVKTPWNNTPTFDVVIEAIAALPTDAFPEPISAETQPQDAPCHPWPLDPGNPCRDDHAH